MTDSVRTSPVIAELLPAGTTVLAKGGRWQALAETDASRWLHEGGERQISNAVMQRWFDNGDAQVAG